MQRVAQDHLVVGLTDLVTLIFLAVLCRDRNRHITLFDLLLRIENGADDKIHRLRSAQSAEVRTDGATLAVDRVTSSATQLRTPEHVHPALYVTLRANFGDERDDFRGRHVLSQADVTGGFAEYAGQLFVAATAAAHQSQADFRGALRRRFRGRGERVCQRGRSAMALKK